ncbi:MAG: flagellar filament capping protein FliD [Selenomonadaceae bacterium]|nr:flagellar filament capping protein FliD [Selenomonadaceae bacterium]
MATINGMLSGTYTAYSTAQKNGTLFSNLNSKKSSASDSINSLWSSTSTSNLSSMGTVLSGLSTINSNVKNLLSSYDTTKETFQMEFDDAMSDLSKAASKMKGYDFSKAAAAGVGTSTTTVDEKTGETTTTVNRPEAMKDALKTVQDLVDKYNSAIDFFNDNSEVSKRVSNMSKTFSDTTYRSALYDQVGITVGSDGKLTVNEDKLAAKIVEDPSKVSRILGQDGLAGKAQDHVSFANSQRDKLFPSVQSMFGDQLSSASMYTGTAFRNMNSISNVGNLLNMMF